MTSRDGSEEYMPAWPIAMPSVTVMVQNSRGVPPAAATPFFTACAWRISAMLQGAASFQQRRHADERLVDLLRRQTHRVIVGAMRRARGTFGHVAAGQLGLEIGLGVHLTRLARRSASSNVASLRPIRSRGGVWPNRGAKPLRDHYVPGMLRMRHTINKVVKTKCNSFESALTAEQPAPGNSAA